MHFIIIHTYSVMQEGAMNNEKSFLEPVKSFWESEGNRSYFNNIATCLLQVILKGVQKF